MFDPHRVLSRNRYNDNSGRILHAKATRDRSLVINRSDFSRYIEILKANGLYPTQPSLPSVTSVSVNIPANAGSNLSSFPFSTTLKPSLDQALSSMSSDYNYLITIKCSFPYSSSIQFRLDNSEDQDPETYLANLPPISITGSSSNPLVLQLPFLVFASNDGSQWKYDWNLNPGYKFTFQNQNVSGQEPPTGQDVTNPDVYPYITVLGDSEPHNPPCSICEFTFTPFIKD